MEITKPLDRNGGSELARGKRQGVIFPGTRSTQPFSVPQRGPDEVIKFFIRIMRHLPVPFLTLALTACSTVSVSRPESPASSPTQKPAAEPQNASLDSVVQFLITAAATDFHTQNPTDTLRFRGVRVGHVMNPKGEKQYLLCGQFGSAGKENKPEWIPFATIKTSGYEQWIGAQAVAYCQGASVIWDKEGDLSSELQTRLDSLR